MSGLEVSRQSEADVQSLYQSLFAAVPGACIFTSISEEPESDVTLTGRPQSNSPDHVNDLSSGTPDEASVQVHDQGDFTDGALCSALDNTPALVIPLSHGQPDCVYDGISDDASVPVLGDNATDTSHDHIPSPLTALHQANYEQMNDEELLKEAEKLFYTLNISDAEVHAIRNATIDQHNCAAWTEQRQGRLTASVFHDVLVRKSSTSPVPLVMKIMGYEKNDLSHVPAIKWGVQNENFARDQYANLMSAEHDSFTCNLTGLWINPLYPHLGVSPDGVTSCSCHGQGVLEIKCQYSARNDDFLTNETCSFLTDVGYLNRKHRYYTQIQGQFMISGPLFCDFFVWTPSVCKVERIYPDVRFWEKLEKQLSIFFVTNVLPEVMSHKLRRSLESDSDSDKENIYCFCQKGSSGRMIACDNRQCQYKWFHYKCVGIKRAPQGTWLCSTYKRRK